MSAVEYLDIEDALRMVRGLGIGPVRDLGLLNSALARPRSTAFGEDAYLSLALKSAALLHSVVGNHALGDGNKRLGLLMTAVFLDLNGCTLDLTDDTAFEVVIDVATGAVAAEAIAERLRVLAR